MCNSCWPTVHALVATRCQYWWGWGPQENKFQHVPSDGHQMSLAGRAGALILYSEVQCIMGNGHMGTP